jgi:hypothetical protein
MKTLTLILSGIIATTVAIAQPSVDRIKADLKKEFPTAISITVKGTGNTVKEIEDQSAKNNSPSKCRGARTNNNISTTQM